MRGGVGREVRGDEVVLEVESCLAKIRVRVGVAFWESCFERHGMVGGSQERDPPLETFSASCAVKPSHERSREHCTSPD